MIIPRRDSNLEVIVPAEGNALAPAPGNTWAWGAYTQITADVGHDFVLCGAYMAAFMLVATGLNLTNAVQWQIATGAAASEVNIADGHNEAYGQSNALNPVPVWIGFSYTWRIDPILIPTGTRLSARFTQSHTAGIFFPALYLFGYDASKFSPSAGNVDSLRFLKGLKTSSHQVVPEAAAGNTVTSGGVAWTYGTWVEFIAAAPNDLLIKTISIHTTSVTTHVQTKIGIGAGGSEVAIAKIGAPGRAGVPHEIGAHEFYRPVYIKKGERVAVQIASNLINKGLPMYMGYLELK